MATNAITKKVERLPALFEDFFKPWNEFVDFGGWGRMITVPAVNIIDNPDEYIVSLAAPGLKKEDFTIDVEGNMLAISNEKEESKEERDAKFTRREYSYSSFTRSFTIQEQMQS